MVANQQFDIIISHVTVVETKYFSGVVISYATGRPATYSAAATIVVVVICNSLNLLVH